MVVLVRDLVNTLFSISTTACQQSYITILPSSTDMDINYDTIRGRPKSSSNNSSRELFVLSNVSSIAHHKHMEALNNILPEEVQKYIR